MSFYFHTFHHQIQNCSCCQLISHIYVHFYNSMIILYNFKFAIISPCCKSVGNNLYLFFWFPDMKKWSLECTWEKSSDWRWRSYGSTDFCSAGKDRKSCPPGGASTQNMFQKLKGSYSCLSLIVWKCTFLAIFKFFVKNL